MVNVLAIMRKEVRLYFASPMAYVVTAAFLVLMGYLFSLLLFFGQEASLRGVFDNMSIIFAFLAPALTMRLFAEENRSGTLELLLTSPVRDIEVVLGKFLASLAFLLALLLPTLYYVFLISIYGNPDFGPIITSYLGAFLMGTA
ncbi:MAG: ABC transporter permease subunit, partial [Chloroflexi bacterium]|nr:ABC transporter permease subunit [Chloroflexota bacterium]